MRQAIETTYRGPTNHQGSRIIVRAQAGRMTVPWDHAMSPEDNHTIAAYIYAQKHGWGGEYVGGAKPGGDGYVFVDAESERVIDAFYRLAKKGVIKSARTSR